MAPVLAYTLPAMQLVCNLVMSDGPVWNDTSTSPTVNQTTTEIPPAVIPADYIAYPDIGVAYKIGNSSITWKAAREMCLAEGARLAVTDSFVKFETVMSKLPTARTAVHLGIRSMYDHTEWVSDTDGSTLVSSTIPWAPGYPNGTNTCVIGSSNPRGLINFPCTGHYAIYACEIPISSKPVGKKSLVAEISPK